MGPLDTPWTVVACTAHRIQHLSLDQRQWSQEKLHRAAQYVRDHCGTEVGVSGMAIGGDLWWADGVVRAGLKLAAHVPCPQQTDRWRDQADRDEHARLLALADPTLSRVVSPSYYDGVLEERNRGMLDVAHAVVALWRRGKTSGGTYRCLRAAIDRGLPIVHLDPGARTVRISAGSSSPSSSRKPPQP